MSNIQPGNNPIDNFPLPSLGSEFDTGIIIPSTPSATDIKFGTEGWKQEEMRRLTESANLNKSIIEVPSGYLTGVEQGPGDYLIFVTSLGKRIAVHRVTALLRAKTVLDMCLAENGAADRETMERDLHTAHIVFKAVIANAKANGKNYDSQAIKRFEQLLIKASKNYKGQSENSNAADNVRRAYGN